jgi:hypothetical protein
LVAVRKASTKPLFSPVVQARLRAGLAELAWIDEPDVDVVNATARAAARQSRAGRPGTP